MDNVSIELNPQSTIYASVSDTPFLTVSTLAVILSKIEKVPRGIRGEKSSKDMASSRNLVSTIIIIYFIAPD